MTTLTLDLGNTALKYGVFTAAGLQASGVLAVPSELAELWQRWQPAHAILASVASEAEAQPWLHELRDVLGKILPLRPGFTPVPLRNAYATPHTLGADRLAGAVGAAYLRPGQPTLVVDAGTALKLDFISDDNTFHGGSIAPGLRMRLRALHTFTGRLPLLELPEPGALVQLIGDSTASSLLSGVLNGAAAEVNGLVADYRRRYPSLGLVLTGGDAPYLQPRLASALGLIFVVPELVLVGLDRILRYNVDR
ncbi:MAG: type III pantothenate kinase [Janthinobacterium lividum]